MPFQILSEELLDELENLPRPQQERWLFLDRSSDVIGRWKVDGLWPNFFFDFENLIGQHKTVSPTKLGDFLDLAEELDYEVVFTDPPERILEEYEHLTDPPPFSLKSHLDGTVQGFLPWQITGFNKLIRNEELSSGLPIWSTGTGKTVFIASAIMWHETEGHPFDLAFVVVKSNNKADMNRKLKKLAGIESVIIDGTPKQRTKIYQEISSRVSNGEKIVAVTNYEKFREDPEDFKRLMKDNDVLCFWDEVPARLSNRSTKLYKAVKSVLWHRFESREDGLAGALPRANWLRQWGLTATPIENNPEGLFNYVRLMNPSLLGKVEEFYGHYLATRNFFSSRPETWRNLDLLEARIEHITHRVSREDDPEVGKLFPKVFEDTLVIDWHPKDRRIYDILIGKAKELIEADFSEANVLAMIQVLQMLCDAPSMIVESAHNRQAFEASLNDWGDEDDGIPIHTGPIGSEVAVALLEALQTPPSDDNHTKLDALREILLEKHPDEKALVFMTWSSYGFKPITKKLDEWGVSYVCYEGSQKQADAAKDLFREDPEIRVFLSSDRGADSIDLPEAAVGVNYNLPWTWVRKKQRMRNVRVDSQLAQNYWYDLIMADSVEERKQDIIAQKQEYHTALFDGRAVEETMASKLTREDLLSILFD